MRRVQLVRLQQNKARERMDRKGLFAEEDGFIRAKVTRW